jgi:peptidoglycan/xylan/chitin deacetylase (PgdA/CDA1 family)
MSEPLVLAYHAISPSWAAPLSVTPDAFERQITKLVRRGWVSANFTEVVRQPPNTKTFAITFDDAFASVKTYAHPILRQLGVTGTVFAPSDYINRQAPLAWAGLDEWELTGDAEELNPMRWNDLAELAEQGWEIGSHTKTHPQLTTLADHALAQELKESRQECSEQVGQPVTSVAYPYGNVDDRVLAYTRDAGYEAAAGMRWPSGRPNRYDYPRVGVYHTDSWARFRVKVGRWSHSDYGSHLIARRQARTTPS